MRTIYFPPPAVDADMSAFAGLEAGAAVSRMRVELGNSSRVALRVRVRLAAPSAPASATAAAAAATAPPFHLKQRHCDFMLGPRSFVLLPVAFRAPPLAAAAESAVHTCLLIVEAAPAGAAAGAEAGTLSLSSRVLLVCETGAR